MGALKTMWNRFAWTGLSALALSFVPSTDALAGDDRSQAPIVLAQAQTIVIQPEDVAPPDANNDFGPCETCVFVLERVKKGTNVLIPTICAELFDRHPNAYGFCNETNNAMSLNGERIRYWLFSGCLRDETYGERNWLKPCPSHVICSELARLDGAGFCAPVPAFDPLN